jgi:hypothetical protein
MADSESSARPDDLIRTATAWLDAEPDADIRDELSSLIAAARSGDAEILVATDAALATPPSGTLEAPVRVLQVGREARNEAIVALAVRTAGKAALAAGATFEALDIGQARRAITGVRDAPAAALSEALARAVVARL